MSEMNFEEYVRERLESIEARLDKLNGRWWSGVIWLLVTLSVGCASMIGYIWANHI